MYVMLYMLWHAMSRQDYAVYDMPSMLCHVCHVWYAMISYDIYAKSRIWYAKLCHVLIIKHVTSYSSLSHAMHMYHMHHD